MFSFTVKIDDRLRERYIERDMTVTEIAKVAECSEGTVCHWLTKFEIQIKDRGEQIRKKWEPGGVHYERIYGTPRLYRNKEWLRVQYLDKRLSIAEIAEKASCTPMTIHRWMEKHGISRRSNAGHIELQPYHDPAWLKQKYWEGELSTAQIAEIAGCHRVNVRIWMNKHNIPLRDKGESVKLAWDQEILGTEKTKTKQSEIRKQAWANGIYDDISGVKVQPASRLSYQRH